MAILVVTVTDFSSCCKSWRTFQACVKSQILINDGLLRIKCSRKKQMRLRWNCETLLIILGSNIRHIIWSMQWKYAVGLLSVSICRHVPKWTESFPARACVPLLQAWD